jgi:hypothetical protein
MKKTIASTLVLLIWSVIFALPLWAQPVLLPELLSSPDLFNDTTIEVEGEVIGEPLVDSDGVWINILNKGVNLGIFVFNPQEIKGITYWGSFRAQGDIIRAKGTFYKECSMHQGVDLHAYSIEIVEKGSMHKQSIPHEKVKWTIIAAVVCLLTVIIYIIKGKYGSRT